MSIDWPTLLADIARSLGDPSIVALAKRLRIPRGTVRNWLAGAEPRHSDGERLIAHWEQLTGQPRAQAPRTQRPLSAALA